MNWVEKKEDLSAEIRQEKLGFRVCSFWVSFLI